MDLVVLFDKENIEVFSRATESTVEFRTIEPVKGYGDYICVEVRLAEVIADVTLTAPTYTVMTLEGLQPNFLHDYGEFKKGNMLSDAEIYEYARRIAAKKISIELKRVFERVLGLVD